ncbi:MAG: hypothetical protein KDA65_02690 [Planctomycetaceae bacterium]|nr:hypothetical protein [Planctomycetaceae bacterium]
MAKKKPSERKRPQIGDVIEIPTPEGIAYAWYTHKNEKWGEFIQIFKGLYPEPQSDLSNVLCQPLPYGTFYDLTWSIKQTEVRIVENVPLTEEQVKLPLFKKANCELRSWKALSWSLWDGKDYQNLDYLAPEYYDLPCLEIPSYLAIVEHIVQGWTNADFVKRSGIGKKPDT